jgi:protein-arginine kinase activator protein McsA
MKQCNKCKQEKLNIEFNKNKRKKDGLQDYCKSCKSESDNKYYLNNTKSFNIRNKKWSDKRSKEIEEIFGSRSCEKCGESRSYVLDFHHIDPTKKLFTIGKRKRVYKKEIILKEIEKCISLCSNCHREFHHFEKQKGITIKEYIIK